MIAAGELNKRITIEEPVETVEAGEVSVRWVRFAEVWASVAPISSREYWQAQQVKADLTHRVRIRYLAGVTSRMRVRLGSRVLQIAAPPRNLDEAGTDLELVCTEQE